jgi:uncharacterized protein (TIGR02246 family)
MYAKLYLFIPLSAALLFAACETDRVNDNDRKEQITEFLHDHQEALQQMNLEGYMAHFTEDVTWHNATGMQLEGKPALREFFERVLPSFEEAEWELRDVSVQMVTDESAHADMNVILRNQILPEGFIEGWGKTVLRERNLINSYVLRKDDSQWFIVAERIRDALQLEWIVE